MVLLNDAVEAKKLDTRVVERNIRRGFLKPEELEKSVKGLPDDSENATYVSIESLAAEDADENSASEGGEGFQH